MLITVLLYIYIYINLVHSCLFCTLFRTQNRGIQFRRPGTSASASFSPLGVGPTPLFHSILYYFLQCSRLEVCSEHSPYLHINYSFIFISLIYPLFSAFVLNKWLSSPSGVGQHVPILVFGEYRGRGVSNRKAKMDPDIYHNPHFSSPSFSWQNSHISGAWICREIVFIQID